MFSLGPVQFRWYGALFVLAGLMALGILKYLSRQNFIQVPFDKIQKVFLWQVLGMLLGSRLLYVMVYNRELYAENMLEIFYFWNGGMSMHGALVGAIFATYFWAQKLQLSLYKLTDSFVLALMPGLLLGRLGNFINGELYGKITESWAGLVFPGGGPMPRHPSQLYEAFLEGGVLSIIMIVAYRKVNLYGLLTALFLFYYGLLRWMAEIFREADPQLGYFLGYFSMGQILSLTMIPLGYLVLMHVKKSNLVIYRASSVSKSGYGPE